MKRNVFISTLLLVTLVLGGLLNPGQIVSAETQAEVHVCSSGCTYTSIQAAVDAAGAGTVIKIAAGTYSGAPARQVYNLTLKQGVYINKSITLAGGYTPGNWTTPDPIANVTTIDAQGQGRVVYINLHQQSVTISGLHLINGDATKAGDLGFSGGGIYGWGNSYTTLDSTITLTNNQISGNTTKSDGPGIAVSGVTTSITGNIISNNTIVGANGNGVSGGGIYLWFTTAQVTGNQILSNSVPIDDYYGDAGGGIYAGYSTVTLSGNTFQGNQAQEGGGMASMQSNLTVSNNSFISNTAAYGGGFYYSPDLGDPTTITLSNNIFNGNAANGGGGGGAWILQNSTLSRNLFENNTTTSFGGGLVVAGTLTKVDDNRFLNNTASQDGGGLQASGTATLTGNLIKGNTAPRGAGVSVTGYGGSHPTFINTVIVDNTLANNAGNKGSAIYIEGQTADFTHTTIARNTGGDGSAVYVVDYKGHFAALTMTNSILAAETTGIHVQPANQATLNTILWYQVATPVDTPATVTVQNQATGDPQFAADGYHIQAGSMAIDAGVKMGVANDIDHQPRPNTRKADGKPDLGADEWYPPQSYIYLPLLVK